MESWCESCKLIRKLQTHMKIANSYENCKHSRRNYRPKCKICKLIWKLQTDIIIANLYENCKAILMFWSIVPMWAFAIFSYETQGNENLFWNKMFWFDCSVDDKNSTKHSFAKPSTIHISIPIPILTQSDSYFNPWFLCSLSNCQWPRGPLHFSKT